MARTPDPTSESSATGVDAALALVCNLSPIDREGRRVGIQYLLERASICRDHADGVALEFPHTDEVARALLDFVLAERQCCTRFAYELGFAPPHAAVTLRVRASGESVKPLKDLYRGLALGAGIRVEVEGGEDSVAR